MDVDYVMPTHPPPPAQAIVSFLLGLIEKRGVSGGAGGMQRKEAHSYDFEYDRGKTGSSRFSIVSVGSRHPECTR